MELDAVARSIVETFYFPRNLSSEGSLRLRSTKLYESINPGALPTRFHRFCLARLRCMVRNG